MIIQRFIEAEIEFLKAILAAVVEAANADLSANQIVAVLQRVVEHVDNAS